MNTRLDSHPRLRFRLLVAAAALSPLVLHADKPTTAVSVEGTVAVQGVVEVLNDVLRQPFIQQVSTSVGSTSPTVDIDIPTGKRLVIETISFQASQPTGEVNRMFFEPPGGVAGSRLLVPLAVQNTLVDGGTTYLTSTLQVNMRMNGIAGSANELRFRRGSGGSGSLLVVVFGYLVDIGS